MKQSNCFYGLSVKDFVVRTGAEMDDLGTVVAKELLTCWMHKAEFEEYATENHEEVVAEIMQCGQQSGRRLDNLWYKKISQQELEEIKRIFGN